MSDRHHRIPYYYWKGLSSPTIDYFDGAVVSWSIGTVPDADLVNTMLDNAIKTLR